MDKEISYLGNVCENGLLDENEAKNYQHNIWGIKEQLDNGLHFLHSTRIPNINVIYF